MLSNEADVVQLRLKPSPLRTRTDPHDQQAGEEIKHDILLTSFMGCSRQRHEELLTQEEACEFLVSDCNMQAQVHEQMFHIIYPLPIFWL